MDEVPTSTSDPYQSSTTASNKSQLAPWRRWVPAVLLLGMLVLKFVPDFVEDGPSYTWAIGAFGPVLLGLVAVLWWLLASRADWSERILGFLGIIAIMVATAFLAHYSISDGTSMIAIVWPLVIAAFALGTVIFGGLLSSNRIWLTLSVAALAGLFTWTLRTDGVRGDFRPDLNWRWVPTAEDNFLAERTTNSNSLSPKVTEAIQASIADPEWPIFRGPNGDGAQHGIQFADRWDNPPEELWRIKIGPAWSSFVVAGKFLFTQEQRGQVESVVCYDGDTGTEIWATDFESRFFEALGGLGPRATPTLAGEYIYAQGAEKWLTKLDAATGETIWKVDLLEISGREAAPMWGFSASPLVYNGQVYTHLGETKDDFGLLALSDEDGSVLWHKPAGKMSYSSPQILSLAGQDVLVMLSDAGASILEPNTGKTLFDYEWVHGGYRALQAQVINGDRLLIPTGMGTGTRLVEFSAGTSTANRDSADPQQAAEESQADWEAETIWTSKRLKPDFNDLVIHDGVIYGFDDRFLAAIDLETGKRLWKGGRYGKGQLLLLADSDLLLVIGEHGELALVRATGDDFEEIEKLEVFTSKTWNHPVAVGDRLYLRNAEEAVCLKLPTLQVSADAASSNESTGVKKETE